MLCTRRPLDPASLAFGLLGGGGMVGIGLWLLSIGHGGGLGPLLIGLCVGALGTVVAQGEQLVLAEDILHRTWLGEHHYPWSAVARFERKPLPDRFSDGTVKHMHWRFVVHMTTGERVEFQSTWQDAAQVSSWLEGACAPST